MRALAPGRTIHSRYQILALAGRGGMGSVYAARDARLGLTVALKQTLASDEVLRRAFRREARLLASLHHPRLPRVLDHFEDEGELFLVMEYVPGDDLGALLARRRAPFDVATVLAWADQLLGAVEYLHGHSPPVLHRDIKPQNLKLTPNNEVVLLDFGLARGAAGGQTQMLSGATLAGYTPHYAPIEQIQGGSTDARADLYAVGATLYHLLAGQPPADALARAISHLSDDADPLVHICELRPELPPAAGDAIMAALAMRAADRPIDAAGLRAALRSAADGAPVTEDGAPAATLPRRARRRRLAGLAAPAVLLAVLVGLLGVAWPAVERSRAAPPPGARSSTPAATASPFPASATGVVAPSVPPATATSTRSPRRPTADVAATARADAPPTAAPATATPAPSPSATHTAAAPPAPRPTAPRPVATAAPAIAPAPTSAPAPIPVIPGTP